MRRRRKATSKAELVFGSRVIKVEGWRADLVGAVMVAVLLLVVVVEVVGWWTVVTRVANR